MKIKQTIQNIVLGGALILAFGVVTTVATPYVAVAADEIKCGGVDTAILDCNDETIDPNASELEKSGVWRILLMVVNFLTAGVGVVALGGIVYGAVLYSASGGNPETVKKARTVFTNVVVGVIAYAGMFVLLNFLVPGGVFQ